MDPTQTISSANYLVSVIVHDLPPHLWQLNFTGNESGPSGSINLQLIAVPRQPVTYSSKGISQTGDSPRDLSADGCSVRSCNTGRNNGLPLLAKVHFKLVYGVRS